MKIPLCSEWPLEKAFSVQAIHSKVLPYWTDCYDSLSLCLQDVEEKDTDCDESFSFFRLRTSCTFAFYFNIKFFQLSYLLWIDWDNQKKKNQMCKGSFVSSIVDGIDFATQTPTTFTPSYY